MGNKTDDLIKRLKREGEERFIKLRAQKLGLDIIDNNTIVEQESLDILSEDTARAANCIVFKHSHTKAHVATTDPETKEFKQVVEYLTTRHYSAVIYLTTTKFLERSWKIYKDIKRNTLTEEGVLNLSTERILDPMSKVTSIKDMSALIQSQLTEKDFFKISLVVEIFLAGALVLNASDVHIEPEEKTVRLRYRLNGVLHDIISFDIAFYNPILQRIKLISGIKINIGDTPQDGRFTIHKDVQKIEVRVSSIPAGNSESLVMRLLDPSKIKLTIENLGMHPLTLQVVREQIARPSGMIITTGPTGSGKTTTLYAFVRSIYNPDKKIITLENPIEYKLQGIVQTQIEGDYTFKMGLNAILRQDPDVILVGEIRDEEVAETAINASLTGHLVFSTLHTNNAAGAFSRLQDLTIAPQTMSAGINVVIAQRLVRVLNQTYTEPDTLTAAQKEVLTVLYNALPDTIKEELGSLVFDNVKKLQSGVLEEEGYTSRVGLYEAIVMNKEIEKAILGGGSAREIREVVSQTQNVLTLAQDAFLKIIKGTISFEEADRVVDLYEQER